MSSEDMLKDDVEQYDRRRYAQGYGGSPSNYSESDDMEWLQEETVGSSQSAVEWINVSMLQQPHSEKVLTSTVSLSNLMAWDPLPKDQYRAQ